MKNMLPNQQDPFQSYEQYIGVNFLCTPDESKTVMSGTATKQKNYQQP
jgi:hypothetical protein